MAGPNSYLKKASLARELEVCESTVDEWVKLGILPKGIKVKTGAVRWRWGTVDTALASLQTGAEGNPVDPFMQGIANVSSVKGSRRGTP